MVDFEELKEKYPHGFMVFQALVIIALACVVELIIIAPLYIFQISEQVVVDVFTFPKDLIPEPFNFIGLVLLFFGFFLVVWANYELLQVGKIGLRNREPMQRPSTLVLTGPYRFTRNPIYLGNIIMLLGLVIFWNGLIVSVCTIVVYLIFLRFIKKEETILEEEFGDQYIEFKQKVRRWL